MVATGDDIRPIYIWDSVSCVPSSPLKLDKKTGESLRKMWTTLAADMSVELPRPTRQFTVTGRYNGQKITCKYFANSQEAAEKQFLARHPRAQIICDHFDPVVGLKKKQKAQSKLELLEKKRLKASERKSKIRLLGNKEACTW